MRTNRITLAVAGLAAAITLAACGQSSSTTAMSSASTTSGGSSSASPSVSSQHNDADVTFAQSMIPHHQQAVAMADLAATRATNQQVKDLAAKIKAAQGPEIVTMTGWLTAWGQPTVMSGMGQTGSMPGMMSAEDMRSLQGMSGADFDRHFLTMMISHHKGAVEMSQTEQAQGSDPGAKALAAKIASAQTAEIAQMQTLLTQV